MDLSIIERKTKKFTFSFHLELHMELFLFEEWIIVIEEQLKKISFDDFQQLLVTKFFFFVKEDHLPFRNYKMKSNQKIVVSHL